MDWVPRVAVLVGCAALGVGAAVVMGAEAMRRRPGTARLVRVDEYDELSVFERRAQMRAVAGGYETSSFASFSDR